MKKKIFMFTLMFVLLISLAVTASVEQDKEMYHTLFTQAEENIAELFTDNFLNQVSESQVIQILNTYKNLYNISEYILFHHENWDGSGYPKGLKGEDIPIKSRIIAIANHFDIVTRNRPNKRNLTKEEASNDLLERAGTLFDPKLVKIFIEKVL